MNAEQVQKASEALDAKRGEYQKMAKEFLEAVEATPAEIEKARTIICDEFERTGGDLPHDSMSYDENLAHTILHEVRSQ